MRGAESCGTTRRRRRGIALALALSACHVAPPVPQIPAWTDGIPDDERELWDRSKKTLVEVGAAGWFVSDAKVSAYLAEVLARLLPGTLPAGVPAPEVRVVCVADRQAGTFVNGTIVVSTSHLAALANEAQLAGVLGHELGHFLGRHGLIHKRYRALSTSTVERMRVARSLEEAADASAVVLMRRAGYDPREMIAALTLIEADDQATRGPVFAWESHPYVPDRVAKLRSELGTVAETESARQPERYEDAMTDLLLVAAQQELDERRLDRARAAIDRHLRHRPESGRGHLLLAEHARLTEPEGRRSTTARQHYARTVELAPNDPDAVRALAFLYRDDGDLERARPLFARYLRVAPQAPDRKLIERYLAGAGTP